MYISEPKAAYDDVEIRIVRPPRERSEDPGLWEYLAHPIKSIRGSRPAAFVAIMQLGNGSSYRVQLPPIPKEWVDNQNPRDYGERVFNWLFPDGSDIQRGFFQARWESESLERSVPAAGRLRIRLSLDKGANDLHAVWWEAMYDPTRKVELALQLPVSRFVRDGLPRLWPISERPLRMMVVVSNPDGLDAYGLKPIDVSLEKELLGEAMSSTGSLIQWRPLSPRPTVDEFNNSIAEMRPHIVYVLAHAVYDGDDGKLVFYSGHAKPQLLSFEKFANLLAPPGHEAPFLVFLALPLQVQVDPLHSLAPLGQKLVSAGVQAVVAVRAPLPEADLLQFTETFFGQLARGGIVDAAICAARRAIYRETPDWAWTYPVLYLRAPDAMLFEPLSIGIQTRLSSLASKLNLP